MFYIIFQSTRPVWGATPSCVVQGRFLVISIHAPRVGRDATACGPRWTAHAFQSTRPVWGATGADAVCILFNAISIHAPRVGRDWYIVTELGSITISIHAPRVGRDHIAKHDREVNLRFQSTRPVWGATIVKRRENAVFDYFNPRAPCGARRCRCAARRSPARFQSTRPVWGATGSPTFAGSMTRFQSTRPVWGATQPVIFSFEKLIISIHAPRVGRD